MRFFYFRTAPGAKGLACARFFGLCSRSEALVQWIGLLCLIHNIKGGFYRLSYNGTILTYSPLFVKQRPPEGRKGVVFILPAAILPHFKDIPDLPARHDAAAQQKRKG